MGWRSYLMALCLIGIMGVGIYAVYHYYGTIFSKTVDGRVVRLKASSGGADSYVIAVRNSNGNIFTSTAQSPRWALVKPGECAEVRFLPYPPWRVNRIGIYASALLIKMRDCRESDGPWPLKIRTNKEFIGSEESEGFEEGSSQEKL